MSMFRIETLLTWLQEESKTLSDDSALELERGLIDLLARASGWLVELERATILEALEEKETT